MRKPLAGRSASTTPYHDSIRLLDGPKVECALQAFDPSGNVRALYRAGNHQCTNIVPLQDDALERVAIHVLENVAQRPQPKSEPPGLPGCNRRRILHLGRFVDA